MPVDSIGVSSIDISRVCHKSNYYLCMYDMQQDTMCSTLRRLTCSKPRFSHLFWPSTRHVPAVDVWKLSLYHLAVNTVSHATILHIYPSITPLFVYSHSTHHTHPSVSLGL